MAPRKATATGTRRSARLAPPEPAKTKTTGNRITKSKAAAKPKPQKYDCTTCGRTLAGSSFPKYLPTDTCANSNHTGISTCKTCCKQWVAAQLDSVSYDQIKCPECPELLKSADVKALASKDVWERFEEMERRGIAEKVPGWRWCMNSKCREGQVHEPLLKKLKEEQVELKEDWGDDEGVEIERKKKKKASMEGTYELIDLESSDAETEEKTKFPLKRVGGENTISLLSSDDENASPSKRITRSKSAASKKTDELPPEAAKKPAPKPKAKKVPKSTLKVNPDDICTCHACGAQACIPCDRPYHDGETCAQSQRRRKRQEEKEVQASEKFIEKDCKKCPNERCGKNIEKNGGCDSVICTQCRTQFCWICRTTYAVVNTTGHAAGCVYARQGAFDPHVAVNAPAGANAVFGAQNGGGGAAAWPIAPAMAAPAIAGGGNANAVVGLVGWLPGLLRR